LISDRTLVPDLARAVERATRDLPRGAATVHLREKDLGGRALLDLARALRAATRAGGHALIVNDRLDVALAAGADGVHLPSAGVPPAEARRLLGPGALVGVSCHSADDVRRARDAGADWATFGPVFDTPSKRRYGAPLGLAALGDAARLGLPVVALGGVEPGNVAAVRAAGARGVAAIRAWLAAADPAAAVRALAEPFLAPPAPPEHMHDHEHDHERPGHAHGEHARDAHGNPADFDAYLAKQLDPEREAWQKPDEVVARLRLAPGARVGEIGAGPGYFTLRLARAVGASGQVDAVDVEPRMLDVLRARLAAERVTNVNPVLSAAERAALPAAAYDAILSVNTVHHIPAPAPYLRALGERLAPGGRLVVIDFHARDTPVGPPVGHRLAREDLLAAAGAAGLEVVEEWDFLPWQYGLALGRR
jgi:thiamine-phosphate pyrophosphorylase